MCFLSLGYKVEVILAFSFAFSDYMSGAVCCFFCCTAFYPSLTAWSVSSITWLRRGMLRGTSPPLTIIDYSIALFCLSSSFSFSPRSAIMLKRSSVIAILLPKAKNHTLPLIDLGIPSIHISRTRCFDFSFSQLGKISSSQMGFDFSSLLWRLSHSALFFTACFCLSFYLCKNNWGSSPGHLPLN